MLRTSRWTSSRLTSEEVRRASGPVAGLGPAPGHRAVPIRPRPRRGRRPRRRPDARRIRRPSGSGGARLRHPPGCGLHRAQELGRPDRLPVPSPATTSRPRPGRPVLGPVCRNPDRRPPVRAAPARRPSRWRWPRRGLSTRADTVLVDGAGGDLAAYHDVGDVIPGLPELVELHRGDRPTPTRSARSSSETRCGYRLMLGLRRARDWAGMRCGPSRLPSTGLQRTHAGLGPDLDDDPGRTEARPPGRHRGPPRLSWPSPAEPTPSWSPREPTMRASTTRTRRHDLHRCGTPAEIIVVVVNQRSRSTVAARAQLARSVRALTDDLGDDGIGAADRASPPASRPPCTTTPPLLLPEGIGCADATRHPRSHRCGAARPRREPIRCASGLESSALAGIGRWSRSRRSTMSTISDSDLRSPLDRTAGAVEGQRPGLDVDTADGRSRLAGADQQRTVEDWADDHARGVRPCDGLPGPPGVVDRAFRNLACYGPLTDLLADPDVWEIMVNAPTRSSSGGIPAGTASTTRCSTTTTTSPDPDQVVRRPATSHRKLDPAEGTFRTRSSTTAPDCTSCTAQPRWPPHGEHRNHRRRHHPPRRARGLVR